MEPNAAKVESRARSALASSPIYDLRELRVECHGEQLLISGRVSTFYYKQLAQEVVRSAAGEWQVINTIDVADGDAADSDRRSE